jgi:uncharacterized damage-inducible protein DinB
MNPIDAMLGEFENEMAGTRKVLERLPADRLEYRPHAKSWTMGELASHLAQLPRWVRITLQTDSFDYDPAAMKQQSLGSAADILAEFDRNVADARAALKETEPESLGGTWTFRVLGEERFTLPRAAVYRTFCMNHQLHHRGQFTIYLRMTDTPVPGMYGPSADEV